MGYYSHFYNPWYSDGFRYGVYGWAGGGWGIYSDWNFAPVHCFRDRRFRGHMRRGRDMERESGHHEPPRGLLTTDTRDFRPERLDRTDRTEDLLHQIGKRHQPRTGGELPDVTDFVGRKGKLPTDVARVVVPDRGKERGVIRDIGKAPKVAETPDLAPEGEGRERQDEKAGARRRRPASRRSTARERSAGGIPVRPAGLVLDKGRPAASQGRPDRFPGRGCAPDRPSALGGAQGAPRTWGSAAAERAPRGAPTEPESGGQGFVGKSRDTRTVPRTPVAKTYEPTGPGRSRVECRGQNRQQWKERGGESAPYSASSAAFGGRLLARRRRRQARLRRPQLQVLGRRRRRPAARRALAAGSFDELAVTALCAGEQGDTAPSVAGLAAVPRRAVGEVAAAAACRAASAALPAVGEVTAAAAFAALPAVGEVAAAARSQPYQPSVKSQPQQRSQPTGRRSRR